MRRGFGVPVLRHCIAIGLLTSLCACATMEKRADALFQRHHNLSIALTQSFLAAEMEDRALPQIIYDMEEALQHACGPLDRVALRRMQGEEVDTALKMAAYESLDGCEASVGQVEHALSQLEEGFARAALSDEAAVGQDPSAGADTP